jgi:uncharacterized membrane protein
MTLFIAALVLLVITARLVVFAPRAITSTSVRRFGIAIIATAVANLFVLFTSHNRPTQLVSLLTSFGLAGVLYYWAAALRAKRQLPTDSSDGHDKPEGT